MAKTCRHEYVPTSPVGTSVFAQACTHCGQLDPDWLNHVAITNRGHGTDCKYCGHLDTLETKHTARPPHPLTMAGK